MAVGGKKSTPPKKTNIKKAVKASDAAKNTAEREEEIARAISIIESKPHMLYIRYLLTKKLNPRYINNELYRLGLSAASEKVLADYYMSVIDPVIRRHSLAKIYQDYKKLITNIITKGKIDGAEAETLNYKLQISKNEDLSSKFCHMVKELDLGKVWTSEIYQAHGSTIENMPTDSDGVRILDVTVLSAKTVDKVLVSEHRSVIEEMILEGVPDIRIEKYCTTKLKTKITAAEIAVYRSVFFNMKLNTLEKSIDVLKSEKNALTAVLKDLNRGVGRFKDEELGVKKAYNDMLRSRINDIQMLLKSFQMAHTDAVFQRGNIDITQAERMFTEIMFKSYDRFNELEKHRDRDTPAVQAQLVRIAAMAYDKAMDAKERMPKGGDKSANMQFGELYKQRLEEISANNREQANEALRAAGFEAFDDDMNINEIGGVDELGVNYKAEEDEDDE